jgi:hypothetical protein
MARRGAGEGGSGGMMAPVLSIATGLLIFVILVIFAPTIAGSIEKAQPSLAFDSSWNNTYRVGHNMSAIPTGASTWITNIQILGVVILIISISIAMYYLKGMA